MEIAPTFLTSVGNFYIHTVPLKNLNPFTDDSFHFTVESGEKRIQITWDTKRDFQHEDEEVSKSQHFLQPDTLSVEYNLYPIKGTAEEFVGFVLDLKNTS